MTAALVLAAVVSGAVIAREALVYYHKHAAEQAAAMTPTVEVTESAPLAPAKPNTVIALHGNNESIVGQLARIPAENEQITEIKAVSDIDNNAGRELLSIISKY